MAYKKTGRPVGRPKTKEYVTLLARVPADLAELVKQYAEQHRLSVAAILREGAEWRIGDGDPRGMGLYLEQSTGTSDTMYYTNTATASGVESNAVLEDIRADLASQALQIQALTEALERQALLSSADMYSRNPSLARVPEKKGGRAVLGTGSGKALLPEEPSTDGNTVLQPSLDKAAMVARLQQMRAGGMSLQRIADQLRAEGVPTLTGRGQWQKGTVDKLLRGGRHGLIRAH
jgi:Recombinase